MSKREGVEEKYVVVRKNDYDDSHYRFDVCEKDRPYSPVANISLLEEAAHDLAAALNVGAELRARKKTKEPKFFNCKYKHAPLRAQYEKNQDIASFPPIPETFFDDIHVTHFANISEFEMCYILMADYLNFLRDKKEGPKIYWTKQVEDFRHVGEVLVIPLVRRSQLKDGQGFRRVWTQDVSLPPFYWEGETKNDVWRDSDGYKIDGYVIPLHLNLVQLRKFEANEMFYRPLEKWKSNRSLVHIVLREGINGIHSKIKKSGTEKILSPFELVAEYRDDLTDDKK